MASFAGQICYLVNDALKLQSQPESPAPPPFPLAPTVTSDPALVPTALHLSRPEQFSGDSGDCRVFLDQCGLHFELQAASYPVERTKVVYIISHLESGTRSHICD